MFRIVGGVILGYIAWLVVIFFSFYGLFLVLGTDRSFHPGNYEVTYLWLLGALLLNFIAGMLGGKVCAIIAARRSAVITLAAVLFVLGVLGWLSVDTGKATVRSGDVSVREAIVNHKEPTWFVLLIPIVGAVGVLGGGRVRVSATVLK